MHAAHALALNFKLKTYTTEIAKNISLSAKDVLNPNNTSIIFMREKFRIHDI